MNSSATLKTATVAASTNIRGTITFKEIVTNYFPLSFTDPTTTDPPVRVKDNQLILIRCISPSESGTHFTVDRSPRFAPQLITTFQKIDFYQPIINFYLPPTTYAPTKYNSLGKPNQNVLGSHFTFSDVRQHTSVTGANYQGENHGTIAPAAGLQQTFIQRVSTDVVVNIWSTFYFGTPGYPLAKIWTSGSGYYSGRPSKPLIVRRSPLPGSSPNPLVLFHCGVTGMLLLSNFGGDTGFSSLSTPPAVNIFNAYSSIWQNLPITTNPSGTIGSNTVPTSSDTNPPTLMPFRCSKTYTLAVPPPFNSTLGETPVEQSTSRYPTAPWPSPRNIKREEASCYLGRDNEVAAGIQFRSPALDKNLSGGGQGPGQLFAVSGVLPRIQYPGAIGGATVKFECVSTDNLPTQQRIGGPMNWLVSGRCYYGIRSYYPRGGVIDRSDLYGKVTPIYSPFMPLM